MIASARGKLYQACAITTPEAEYKKVRGVETPQSVPSVRVHKPFFPKERRNASAMVKGGTASGMAQSAGKSARARRERFTKKNAAPKPTAHASTAEQSA